MNGDAGHEGQSTGSTDHGVHLTTRSIVCFVMNQDERNFTLIVDYKVQQICILEPQLKKTIINQKPIPFAQILCSNWIRTAYCKHKRLGRQ